MASSPSSVLSPPAPRLGSETPRIFTPPLRPLTPKTSLGFALIDFADGVLGIDLLPWQKWLAVHALEVLPDGTFRFRTVLLLVARQSGKSTFLQILALFFLYVRGVALVIGTAQNLDIAEEVWQGAVDIARDIPELAAEIERVNMTNGKKALELRGRERYKVQAANRRGGRGLSGDLVLLDELREHQTWDAWGAVTKTTMARPLAQVWAASNAGDAESVVLSFLRGLAHKAIGDPDHLDGAEADTPDDLEPVDDASLGIFEWSAAPGCSLDDREAWAAANPSLGHTITERAVLAARRTDPEPVFRTEVLCQWVGSIQEHVIPAAAWDACLDTEAAEMDGKPVYGVDISPNRKTASVGVAFLRTDGLPQVEVAAQFDSTSGQDVTSQVVPWLLARRRMRFVVDAAGPGASLVKECADHRLVLETVSAREHAQACGKFYDDVLGGRLRHLDSPALASALAGADKRPSGEAWLWSRKTSTADITPLVAVTLARWALGAKKKPQVIDMAAVLAQIDGEGA